MPATANVGVDDREIKKMSDMVIDQIVNDIVIRDRPTEWLAANGINGRAVIANKNARNPDWTPAEDAWLRENLPVLGVAGCAEHLGRSENGIKVHATRRGYTMPRYAPGYFSCRKIADILGVDNHAPPNWVDIGLLRGERIPYDDKIPKRRVKILDFKLWLIRPTSWVYFDVRRMRDPYFRRLVELAQQRWGDEWWSTRQAADYLGCTTKTILHNILFGRLYGYHAIGKERRRTQHWAFWFVRRSEIEKFHLPTYMESGLSFTPAADEFILRARIEWKLPCPVIARMMKYPGQAKSINNRIRTLARRRGLELPDFSERRANA